MSDEINNEQILILLLNNNILRAWKLSSILDCEEIFLKGEIYFQTRGDLHNILYALTDCVEYLNSSEIKLKSVILLSNSNDNNSNELLLDAVENSNARLNLNNTNLANLFKSNGQRLFWNWVLSHLNLQEEQLTDELIKDKVLTWLVTENLFESENLERELQNQKNAQQLKEFTKQKEQLEAEIKQLKLSNAPSLESLCTFLPLIFNKVWNSISASDLMYVAGHGLELPKIPSPFREPTGKALDMLRFRFTELSEEDKIRFKKFCKSLLNSFNNLNIRPEWRSWIEGV